MGRRVVSSYAIQRCGYPRGSDRRSAHIGQSVGSAARSFLYSGSPAYFFLKVLTAFRSSSSSTSSTLETIPVVSSKPRLQLRRQPRMRSMTVRSSAFTATSLVPGELELRTFRPMHRSESRGPAADPEALHLDRVPARRKDDRSPCPGGRLFGTNLNTGEAKDAGAQETAEVRLKGPDPRLIRKLLAAELIRLCERLEREIRVAPLEEIERSLSAADPPGVHPQQRGQHRIADEPVDAVQVELDPRP